LYKYNIGDEQRMRAIMIGVCAAFFFASTFVLNRMMDLDGGSWIWSASLRFLFMIPFLFMIVKMRGNTNHVYKKMKEAPLTWLGWSFVGFGLFYAPLCFAAAFGPGWLIASSWQTTIVAGILLTPLFYKKIHTKNGVLTVRESIPWKGFWMSTIILLGIAIMQVEHANSLGIETVMFTILPILIACFAYPLGNRKMMEICNGELDTFQRVYGMTLASLPFWLVLSIYGYISVGLPSLSQVIQCLIVAISSGIIATVLFFYATDMVRGDMNKLAAVEATQSGAVVFSLIGELVILDAPLPNITSWIGMSLVVIGMILHSYISNQKKKVVQDSSVSAN